MSKYLHLENCKCGSGATDLTEDHNWYVFAAEYSFCFWNYLRHNSRPHTLDEIAKLLKLSISAITSIEKKGRSKLHKRLKLLHYGKL